MNALLSTRNIIGISEYILFSIVKISLHYLFSEVSILHMFKLYNQIGLGFLL
jgi:hypothetical protein